MPPPTVQRVTVRATVPTSSSLNALQEQTIIARWLQIIASRSGQTLVEKQVRLGAGQRRSRATSGQRLASICSVAGQCRSMICLPDLARLCVENGSRILDAIAHTARRAGAALFKTHIIAAH